MKITVLNGSPRQNGNTARMINIFRNAAEVFGHDVKVFDVCRMDIHGCLACEYCHGKGQLKCVIDRFYSALYPRAPKTLKKVAMFLSSGDSDMYDGAKFSYDGDFLGYLGLEDIQRKFGMNAARDEWNLCSIFVFINIASPFDRVNS